jgi:hypothetical protein
VQHGGHLAQDAAAERRERGRVARDAAAREVEVRAVHPGQAGVEVAPIRQVLGQVAHEHVLRDLDARPRGTAGVEELLQAAPELRGGVLMNVRVLGVVPKQLCELLQHSRNIAHMVRATPAGEPGR